MAPAAAPTAAAPNGPVTSTEPASPALGPAPTIAGPTGQVALEPASPVLPPASPPLPARGTPVFAPSGLYGVVAGQTGSTAIVNPVGGGPPGMLVPNGNGTATIFQPGGPPVTIVNPAR